MNPHVAIPKDLYVDLIRAAGKLATVSNQAATLLSEEFDTLVTPSVEELRAVLARCPPVDTDPVWTGKLEEKDLQITHYRSAVQPANEEARGTKIVHLPTGIGRQSDSKTSQLQNTEVAMRALTEAVAKEFKRRGA